MKHLLEKREDFLKNIQQDSCQRGQKTKIK